MEYQDTSIDTSVESVENTDVEVATTETEEESQEQTSTESEEVQETEVQEEEQAEGEEEETDPIDKSKAFAERLSKKTKQVEEKYSPYVSLIEKAAKKNGMSTEEYIQAINEQEEQERIEAERQEDLNKYGDLPPEVVEKLKKADEYEKTQTEQQNWVKEGQAFREAFPKVDTNSIPDAVFEIKDKEKCSLVAAYKSYQYDMQNSEKYRVEQEQKLIKSLNKNKQMPGSASAGAEHKERQIKDISSTEFEKMIEAVKRGEKINL